MEYVEGKPLHGPLGSEKAVKLALQIAGALEEAHGRGILHRDLKPANIMLTPKGSIKILDFGLAKLTAETDSDATQTMEGTILGTAAYMAPEQAEGKPLDRAFGCLQLWSRAVRDALGQPGLSRGFNRGGAQRSATRRSRAAAGTRRTSAHRRQVPRQATGGPFSDHGGSQGCA